MSERSKFWQHFKQNFLTGFILLLPFIGTIYVLYLLIKFSNKLLKILIPVQGIPQIPGLGLLLALIIIYIIGYFSNKYFGKKVLDFWEKLLSQIPGIRGIYSGLKKFTKNISVIDRSKLLKVVAVEYPRKGIYAIGFITSYENTLLKNKNENLKTIFLPTSPNPTSGFIIIAKEEDLIPLDLTIDEAFSYIISGGIVSPVDEKISGEEK